MECSCGLPLTFIEDGFGTDRGYVDASYFECLVCGEVDVDA